MSTLKSVFWPLAVVAVFVALPLEYLSLRHSVYVITGAGPLILTGIVALLALLLIAASAVFFALAMLGIVLRFVRPSTISSLQRTAALLALAGGSFAGFIDLALGLFDSVFAALVYALAIGLYLVFTIPASRRHIGYKSLITVRCTPEAAFALISNPRNWPRYETGLVEIREPLDAPLRVGSIVRERARIAGSVFDGEDEVTLIEPSRKLGFRVRTAGSTDLYEFTPVDGGTELSHTVDIPLSISDAVIGGALTRSASLERLLTRRKAIMQRIKEILEAPGPATV